VYHYVLWYAVYVHLFCCSNINWIRNSSWHGHVRLPDSAQARNTCCKAGLPIKAWQKKGWWEVHIHHAMIWYWYDINMILIWYPHVDQVLNELLNGSRMSNTLAKRSRECTLPNEVNPFIDLKHGSLRCEMTQLNTSDTFILQYLLHCLADWFYNQALRSLQTTDLRVRSSPHLQRSTSKA